MTFMVLLLLKIFETASTWKHGTEDNQDLCPQDTVTHIWLQNKLSLFPFKVRAVFLHQHAFVMALKVLEISY